MGEGPRLRPKLPSPMFPGSHSRDSSSLAVFLLQMVLLCLCLPEPPPQSHMSLRPRTSIPQGWGWAQLGRGWGLCSESSSQNVLAFVTLCQFHLGQKEARTLGIGLGHSGHWASQVTITGWVIVGIQWLQGHSHSGQRAHYTVGVWWVWDWTHSGHSCIHREDKLDKGINLERHTGKEAVRPGLESL